MSADERREIIASAMLPPEPQRSRASELKAELRIPKAKDQRTDQTESKDAQLALEALLSARKLRKQSEADRQRLLRQRQRWDKVCENALNGVNGAKSTDQTESEPRA